MTKAPLSLAIGAEDRDSLDGCRELLPLVSCLPHEIQKAMLRHDLKQLLEVTLDLGRAPELRFTPGKGQASTEHLETRVVNSEDLEHVVTRVSGFSAGNRAGIDGTLHRVAAIRNRVGDIIGLTLRVGYAQAASIGLFEDLVARDKNVLVLGRPASGKTTRLREIARFVADSRGKRVMVIDSANEIGGDGDVPHPALGGARRLQIRGAQHEEMLEAIDNHLPEVLVVDELKTRADALAARRIAEQGVELVAGARVTTLENLMLHPKLSDLVGGNRDHWHELGNERGNERSAPPTFDVVVEIVGFSEVIVHHDAAATVDALLRDYPPGQNAELREAVIETEHAIDRVLSEGGAVSLAPRTKELRNVQSRILGRYHLLAKTAGTGFLQHLVIYARS